MRIATFLLCVALLSVGCDHERFHMPAAAMEPTIKAGETVVADRGKTTPKRWDIVVFEKPNAGPPPLLYCFRVVGLPGDVIDFEDDPQGGLLINGKPPQLPQRLAGIDYRMPGTLDSAVHHPVQHPLTVPPHSYYVLGDNVDAANDSRFWGVVPAGNIVATVIDR